MMFNNSGYDWKAGMSNRAVEAYDYGAMPKSKWTKSTLVCDIVWSIFDGKISPETRKALEAHSLEFLKKNFLEYDSWHHTGKCYNRTDFYRVAALGESEALEILQREEIKAPEVKDPAIPANANWVEFSRTSRGWKAEEYSTYGRIVDHTWFFALNGQKKKLGGKNFHWVGCDELELKREYRKVKGTLKGFKAWMEGRISC